jgi:hypothetical protein
LPSKASKPILCKTSDGDVAVARGGTWVGGKCVCVGWAVGSGVSRASSMPQAVINALPNPNADNLKKSLREIFMKFPYLVFTSL